MSTADHGEDGEHSLYDVSEDSSASQLDSFGGSALAHRNEQFTDALFHLDEQGNESVISSVPSPPRMSRMHSRSRSPSPTRRTHEANAEPTSADLPPPLPTDSYARTERSAVPPQSVHRSRPPHMIVGSNPPRRISSGPQGSSPSPWKNEPHPDKVSLLPPEFTAAPPHGRTVSGIADPFMAKVLAPGSARKPSLNTSNASQSRDVMQAVRSSLIEARLHAADDEVTIMHKALAQEKRANAELRQQLQQWMHLHEEMSKQVEANKDVLSDKDSEEDSHSDTVDPAEDEEVGRVEETKQGEHRAADPLLSTISAGRDFVAPPGNRSHGILIDCFDCFADASDRVKALVKRMNELRRHAKVEIFRLKQDLMNLRGKGAAGTEP